MNGKLEAGFGVKIGGGLSSAPHLAQTLPVFLKPEQVLPLAHYASVLYRDHGYREKRNRARLKFLIADLGAEQALAKIEELGNLKFERHTEFNFPVDPETDHLGIVEQKQPGLWFVGVSLAGGRVRAHELRTLARLARKYAAPGQDRIGCTNKQNLLLLNIPREEPSRRSRPNSTRRTSSTSRRTSARAASRAPGSSSATLPSPRRRTG